MEGCPSRGTHPLDAHHSVHHVPPCSTVHSPPLLLFNAPPTRPPAWWPGARERIGGTPTTIRATGLPPAALMVQPSSRPGNSPRPCLPDASDTHLTALTLVRPPSGASRRPAEGRAGITSSSRLPATRHSKGGWGGSIALGGCVRGSSMLRDDNGEP